MHPSSGWDAEWGAEGTQIKGYLLLSRALEIALCIPQSVGKSRAAGARPDPSLVHGFSGSVFHYPAIGSCIAAPWLFGVQGMLAPLLLPAENLLWALEMG